MDKIHCFFQNTQLLQESLGIVPLMYGSLGLEYLTGGNLNADDLDILIPRTFLTDRWSEFQNLLEENGYALIDPREHTFEKDGLHYSYAQIEELESFAGIPLFQIETRQIQSLRFRLLSLEQYLAVYTASIRDGYRIEVRGKKDAEKIAFIQQRLTTQ